MNSATAVRYLILVIPAACVVFRLLPAEHQRYRNLKIIASQVEQGRIGGARAFLYKKVGNKFSSTLPTRRFTWTI